MMHFVLTANSPGEVAAWLTPTVRALRRRKPDARIDVFIVPCAFAAGTETEVVGRLTEVDRVYGPKTYWRVALGGALPEPVARARKERVGAVLYLGGDLVHAVRLARRLRFPALAYVERGSRWTRSFIELLVADEEAKAKVMARGEAPERVRVVGDLMVDAVAPTGALHLPGLGVHPDRPVVAVFPGSRPYEIGLALPFLLRALEIVRDAVPDVQPLISLAPFASPDLLHGRLVPELEGTALRVQPLPGGGWTVRTAGGLVAPAVQGVAYDVMDAADLAVTIPGSNTAEMAAAGLPMVVALPLNLAEQIPLPGAAQYAEKLPFIGKALKRRLVRRAEAAMPFVAWPNRKAKASVVPEVRGVLTPGDVADVVISLVRDERARKETAAALRDIFGPKGAADRVAERLVVAAASAGKLRGAKTL